MIRILVVPNDKWACDLYRCSGPHKKLQEMFPDEFQCDIDYSFDFKNIEKLLHYNILHLHSGLYQDHLNLIKALIAIKNKVTIILDFDDFWELPNDHEGYETLSKLCFKERALEVMHYADYITCTHDYFSKILSKYNKNVIVIPNAVDTSIKYEKTKSDKIRFGFTGSKSHIHDYKQLIGVTSSLPKDILEKCQFVLCGFNSNVIVDNKGKPIRKCVLPSNAYYQYETLITNNYSIVSQEYKDWLLKFEETDCPFKDEPYIRKWYKPIDNYLELYNDIDVLISPLVPCEFNNCKSNLKFLEAGLTNTGIIATNTGPYSIIGKDILENKNGNCRLVDPIATNWLLAIQLFVVDPSLIEQSKINLCKDIKQFDLTKVTEQRASIYKQLIN